MRRLFIFAIFLLPLTAIAQQSDSLIANGYAKYSELDNEIYLGALFLGIPVKEPGAIRSSELKRMEIKVITDKLSYRRLARIFVKSSAINNRPATLVENAEAMETFLGVFRGNLNYGDHIVLTNTGQGFTLAINGVELATIDSPALFNMLLNIWIGDVPPSREFKAAILGKDGAFDIMGQYNQVSPGAGRVAVMESWLRDAEQEDIAAAEEEAELQRLAEEALKAEQQAQLAQEQEEEKQRLLAVAAAAKAKQLAEEKAAAAARAAAEKLAAEETDEPPADDDEFSAENLLAVQLYANKLLIHSQQKMAYPSISRRLGHTGTVIASVTIDRDGKILSSDLTQTSKYSPLNAAVKKGIKRSAPYPVIPEQIKGDSFSFQVPVKFQIN